MKGIDGMTRRWPVAVTMTAVLAMTGCSAGTRSSGDRAAPAGPPAGAERGAGVAPGEQTDAAEDPQSTFALDVDTASYGYASRLINEGRRPDPTAVRPEEFVNAFEQEYPEPSGDGFAVHLDGARLPDRSEPAAAGGTRLLRVGLQTRGEDPELRPDANLTFVVDVSGSMAEPGRLDLVQDALHTLVDQLRASDAVAIVAFNGRPRVVREMTRVSDRTSLHAAIDSLEADGSTGVEGGLTLGYRVARSGFRKGGTNRVIILSDGLANVGHTEASPILRQIREEAAKEITLLGVGVGSEYGDELMEQLADRGDGFVVYVSERSQAREIFTRRLPAALQVRALDAKVQVTFDPGAVRSYRLIGYDNRQIADDEFRDDRVDGGEVGPGHSVTALYEVRLTGSAARSDRVASVRVRWTDPAQREAMEVSGSVLLADLERDLATAGPRVRVCYAAAYFAQLLRQGPGEREVDLAELAAVADRAADETEDPEVRDLATLIRRAERLR